MALLYLKPHFAICRLAVVAAILSPQTAMYASARESPVQLVLLIPWVGGVLWKTYYGKVGTQLFIPANEAYLMPVGVPNQFTSTYGPADYMETVNTNGLPYYAKQELMPFDKGVELQAQTNVIHMNNRPNSVVKLTTST